MEAIIIITRKAREEGKDQYEGKIRSGGGKEELENKQGRRRRKRRWR
jgi:hypothetical protein